MSLFRPIAPPILQEASGLYIEAIVRSPLSTDSRRLLLESEFLIPSAGNSITGPAAFNPASSAALSTPFAPPETTANPSFSAISARSLVYSRSESVASRDPTNPTASGWKFSALPAT
jgi:hypothetical protein